MSLLKASFFVAAGIVLGASGYALMPAVSAQAVITSRIPAARLEPRLTETVALSTKGYHMTFVKDIKSGGCWLMAEGVLAVAPAAACD